MRNAQRKRIKAMTQDPEMQQIAATARPREPERSPQPDTSDKQRMKHRLATMAMVAERDLEIEQRIRDRADAKEHRRTRQEYETDGSQQLVPVPQWDDRHHAVLAKSLANRAGGLRPLVRVLRSDVRQLPLGMVETDRIQTEPMPATLPGIEPVQPSPVPVLPFVAMFDRAGGTSMTRGRGAAVGMRLRSVNPAALKAYPPLSPDDLAVMAYAPADLAASGARRRDQRRVARKALNLITELAHAVVLPSRRRDGVSGCVQVLPPSTHKAAHDAAFEVRQPTRRST